MNAAYREVFRLIPTTRMLLLIKIFVLYLFHIPPLFLSLFSNSILLFSFLFLCFSLLPSLLSYFFVRYVFCVSLFFHFLSILLFFFISIFCVLHFLILWSSSSFTSPLSLSYFIFLFIAHFTISPFFPTSLFYFALSS
jgi:hypothetical protein